METFSSTETCQHCPATFMNKLALLLNCYIILLSNEVCCCFCCLIKLTESAAQTQVIHMLISLLIDLLIQINVMIPSNKCNLTTLLG